MSEKTNLTEQLETLEQQTHGKHIAMTQVLHIIGNRGYGPLLLIVALLAVLPTGFIPGVPSVCGLSIALIAGQLTLGKRSPWLPRRIRAVSIQRERFTAVLERLKPWTRRLDRFVKPRLEFLTYGLAPRFIGLACVALGLGMIPLELLPFAAAAPALAIAMIGLGLSGKDGVWVLLGAVPAAAALWFIYRLIPS